MHWAYGHPVVIWSSSGHLGIYSGHLIIQKLVQLLSEKLFKSKQDTFEKQAIIIISSDKFMTILYARTSHSGLGFIPMLSKETCNKASQQGKKNTHKKYMTTHAKQLRQMNQY